MTRYKIRKEKKGGYIFDAKEGNIKFIQDDEINKLKLNPDYEFILPSKLPKNYFAAPSKIYMELTRKCNLRCKTCYNSAGQNFENELKKEEIFKILTSLKKEGTFEIRFTGGEPTLKENFFEIVSYAKSLGFFISIGTNGAWSDELLRKVVESEIDMIIISLDGNKETHNLIRGNGTYEKTINSLDYISKNTNKQLRINMTIAKYNIQQIEHIVNLAEKLNIPVINTMPIRLSGRAQDNMKDKLLSPLDYLNFIKHIERIRQWSKVRIQSYFDILGEKSRWLENQTSLINKKTCAAGVEACVINPTGNVYGCAASNPEGSKEKEELFITGNVRDKDIIEIWHDEKRWEIYRNFKKNKSPKCIKCKHYMKKCFGNCFISSYFNDGHLNSNDPYCFTHLLEG